jgi:hypothetical protein
MFCEINGYGGIIAPNVGYVSVLGGISDIFLEFTF